jgi:hypothetical protein
MKGVFMSKKEKKEDKRFDEDLEHWIQRQIRGNQKPLPVIRSREEVRSLSFTRRILGERSVPDGFISLSGDGLDWLR